jgi:hypothetical protein
VLRLRRARVAVGKVRSQRFGQPCATETPDERQTILDGLALQRRFMEAAAS